MQTVIDIGIDRYRYIYIYITSHLADFKYVVVFIFLSQFVLEHETVFGQVGE